ncbi:MAG: relaxase/mobilization nuclease domain-containing protein [Oscillospiraceae bacterium]
MENPDKTDNPKFFEKQDMTDRETQGLFDVISYAVDTDKTGQTDNENAAIMQSFVSGINCYPATARDEMIVVKKRFGKNEGVMAYHGYQSFAKGEVTPEQAHEIGVLLAEKLWGEKYQVVVATHLDKDSHLHNHFVVNTVSFVDGIRYYRSAKDYHNMQTESDTLCREYGLSVIENPQRGKSKQYGEWRAEQEQRPTWRGLIKADIDAAIRQSMTERQFFDALKRQGYEIKIGKDISVRPPKKERFMRLMRNFGEDYSIDNIRSRILSQSRPERPLSEAPHKTKTYRVKGNLKTAKKLTGFRALYIHYCYLLGVFPKNRPQSNKRLHFLLREDLMKLDNISKEARLLGAHRINTAEQLSSYKAGLETEIKALSSDRKLLYRKSRTKGVTSDESKLSEVKGEISVLSKRINTLRREVHLCDDIAVRSGVMAEKIKAVREDEQSKGKEKNRNEQFRRRSGTNR